LRVLPTVSSIRRDAGASPSELPLRARHLLPHHGYKTGGGTRGGGESGTRFATLTLAARSTVAARAPRAPHKHLKMHPVLRSDASLRHEPGLEYAGDNQRTLEDRRARTTPEAIVPPAHTTHPRTPRRQWTQPKSKSEHHPRAPMAISADIAPLLTAS